MKITENRWWSAQAALRLSHVQFCQYSSFHVIQEEMVAVLLLNLLAVFHVGMVALALDAVLFLVASALGTDDDAVFALLPGATHC